MDPLSFKVGHGNETAESHGVPQAPQNRPDSADIHQTYDFERFLLENPDFEQFLQETADSGSNFEQILQENPDDFSNFESRSIEE